LSSIKIPEWVKNRAADWKVRQYWKGVGYRLNESTSLAEFLITFIGGMIAGILIAKNF